MIKKPKLQLEPKKERQWRPMEICEEKPFWIEGKILEISYKPMQTTGYIIVETDQGNFAVTIDHRCMGHIMENEIVGNHIKLQAIKEFVTKII